MHPTFDDYICDYVVEFLEVMKEQVRSSQIRSPISPNIQKKNRKIKKLQEEVKELEMLDHHLKHEK